MVKSPLDPFLVRFLELVQSKGVGYKPGRQTKRFAKELRLQEAFIDALFASARTRALLKPAYRKGGKVHWQVSERGLDLIQAHIAQEPRPNPARK